MARDLEVVRHFHHARLQVQRALSLEAVSLRIHDHTAVGTRNESRESIRPDAPILLEEGGEPLATDSSLSLEEPDELVQVSAQASRGKSENHCHAGQVAGIRQHVSTRYSCTEGVPVNEKVRPRTVVHKVHGLSALDLFRILHTRIARLQKGCKLLIRTPHLLDSVNKRVGGTLSCEDALDGVSACEGYQEPVQERKHIDANVDHSEHQNIQRTFQIMKHCLPSVIILSLHAMGTKRAFHCHVISR